VKWPRDTRELAPEGSVLDLVNRTDGSTLVVKRVGIRRFSHLYVWTSGRA